MDNRIIFREILGDIRRAADEAGGVITKEEIKERLSHLPLGEDHLKMIYQYLSEQGIQVPDDAQEAAELPTGEEGFALSIYLEELQQLAESMTGVPKPIETTDRPVCIVEYRDGTVIDVIREIKK